MKHTDRQTAAGRLRPIKPAQKGFTKNVTYLFLALYLWAMIFGAVIYSINS